jgi:transcriptional regulator with GAF, ATPase, and Fis domain
MKQVLALGDKIAAVPDEPGVGGLITTLILGQTGTGKEVVARYIHNKSLRSDRPFVQVNCTAIPENLFEAELFGHEKGTFTDAKAMKKGLMEMADGGTLFLDEVGDMPLTTQAKLLVAIESGRFRRLGGTSERVVNVRVVAATNTEMERKVREGEFRADLFYRLKGFCLELPPLRERDEDLLLLAQYFAEEFCRKFHKPLVLLPVETRDLLKRYAWPGNVRELANVIQRAILVNDTSKLEPGMLGLDVSAARVESPEGGDAGRFDFVREDCTLAAVERRLLEAALKYTSWNISETARLLGLTRGGLRHRLEKMGLT